MAFLLAFLTPGAKAHANKGDALDTPVLTPIWRWLYERLIFPDDVDDYVDDPEPFHEEFDDKPETD